MLVLSGFGLLHYRRVPATVELGVTSQRVIKEQPVAV
jgi:hypothetical protein